MATPFSIIFQRFLNKITDSDLAALPTDNLESVMSDFLQSSIVRFRKCQQDLNQFDTVTMQFNVDLSLDEIEILAELMKYEWINQELNRAELYKQTLSSKEYAMYSQANHIDKMALIKQQLYTETNQMITDYTYDFGKLDDLR